MLRITIEENAGKPNKREKVQKSVKVLTKVPAVSQGVLSKVKLGQIQN